MSEIIPFSFPLNQGMHAFLRVRDSLRCLAESQDAYAWLQAGADLRCSVLGEQGRHPAIPEVINLLVSTQEHLKKLAANHPEFAENIHFACENMDLQVQHLRDEQETIAKALSEHSLLTRYSHSIQQYDWLGHKYLIPQGFHLLWQEMTELHQPLMQLLEPLIITVKDLDIMLHDSVSWQQATASNGVDSISPEHTPNLGLLVIGLSSEQVRAGVVPEVSGNRMAIRLNFHNWTAQGQPELITTDVSYQHMMVPIG
ncbi:MAG: cell division protein ZapD [Mariprofundaceae bacterium]|nr:cell division protein ZapD [Mariprofundaceae bacterium]